MSYPPVGKNNRVLVTGGSGFIGAALCKLLLLRGYQVWVLSRHPERVRPRLDAAVRLASSLEDLGAVDFGAIINLAGKPMAESRWSTAVKQALRDSRIDLTYALLAWCQERQQFPPVLINGSAIGIYGNGADRILTESSPTGDDFAARLCADWEEAAAGFASHGVRVCMLRTGVVLDREGGALARMLPAFRWGLGGRLGTGEHFMSWIHRQDLLQIIIRLLEDESLSGAFNATAPEACRNRDFTRQLAECLHRPAIFPMPAPILRLLFGEFADGLLLASQRVHPERLLQIGFTFSYPGLKDAFSAILKKV